MAKKPDSDAPTDGGAAEVQEKVDADNAKGFHGTKVDPTPNEHYAFAGAAADKPTPETDAAHAAEVAAHTAAVARGEVSANA